MVAIELAKIVAVARARLAELVLVTNKATDPLVRDRRNIKTSTTWAPLLAGNVEAVRDTGSTLLSSAVYIKAHG
jgi:hypothetical protein